MGNHPAPGILQSGSAITFTRFNFTRGNVTLPSLDQLGDAYVVFDGKGRGQDEVMIATSSRCFTHWVRFDRAFLISRIPGSQRMLVALRSAGDRHRISPHAVIRRGLDHLFGELDREGPFPHEVGRGYIRPADDKDAFEVFSLSGAMMFGAGGRDELADEARTVKEVLEMMFRVSIAFAREEEPNPACH